MNSKKTLLLIFVKNAVFGKVKTRLAADVGNEKAMEIYQQLLAYTAHAVNDVEADIAVFYSQSIEKGDLWEGVATVKGVQEGGALGERMANAFHQYFSEGYQRIAIIGSDCAEINAEIINTAFEKLSSRDVVLGKAEDGGYYLLGLSKMRHELFIGKSWSTDTVAKDTIEDCKRLGLSLHLLPTLSDIDYVADWKRFEEQLEAFSASEKK